MRVIVECCAPYRLALGAFVDHSVPSGVVTSLGAGRRLAQERRHRDASEDADPAGPPAQSPIQVSEMQSAIGASQAVEHEGGCDQEHPKALRTTALRSQVITSTCQERSPHRNSLVCAGL